MFNKQLKPMLLKEVDKPFNDDNFIYELKYDGIRALIYVSNEYFKITNRHGVNITNKYPELKSIQKLVGNKEVIFDGEIVAFDNNKPSFSMLQHRSYLKDKNKIEDMKDTIPVAFIAFDILYQNKDLTNIALMDRKDILNNYKDNECFIKSKVYFNGLDLFKKIRKLNLEGIVAKEKNSIYVPNKRVDYWLKIKNFKKEEFYIHGYIKNKIKYSLFLGEYIKGKLYYVGKVSVMDKNNILKSVLKTRKVKNKFVNFDENVNYVEPINKIKVHYMERTLTNMLRQPFVK